MRRLVAALTTLLLAACSGPTGPGNDTVPDGPLEMALVSGGGQEVQVTDTLPSDILARIEKGGTPLGNELVDWRVLNEGCGEPFVTTTRTDSLGRTGNRLVAGTRASTRPEVGVCEMQIRYALRDGDSVIAEVDTTVGYRVLPDVITTMDIGSVMLKGVGQDTVEGRFITDQYGNPGAFWVEASCCAHRAGDDPGTVGARTLVWDSAGKGELSVVAGDSVLDRALLTTDADSVIEVDFRNY